MTGIDLSTDHKKAYFLWRYFVHRRQHYAVQKADGNYKKVPENITLETLLKHVRGEHTIGTYQMQLDNTTKWIVYDVDCHDGDDHEVAEINKQCILDVLSERHVTPLIERSGSPGSYHLWILLTQPVDAETVYEVSRQLITDRGIRVSNCEVFPKQKRIDGRKPYGNLVKLPLGKNRRTDVFSTFENMGDFETYDLERIRFSNKNVDLTKAFRTKKPQRNDVNIGGESNSSLMLYKGVRPCVKYLLENVQMVYYPGHRLRIGCASELLAMTDMSDTEIALQFKNQADFDLDKSLEGVRSVHGYHRPKCSTIRSFSKQLSVDIDNMCSECMLR